MCILQKGVCVEFLNIPSPTLFCFWEEVLLFFVCFKEKIVNKQVWKGSLLKMHYETSAKNGCL